MPSSRCKFPNRNLKAPPLPCAVRNRIRYSRFSKRAQAQQATVASATGCIFALIARPRQMQRRPKPTPRRMISLFLSVITGVTISMFVSGRVPTRTNLGTPGNTRACNPDIRSCLRQPLRCIYLRTDRFRPAHRHGKKMRIAKWHIGHGNVPVRRRRPTHLPARQSFCLLAPIHLSRGNAPIARPVARVFCKVGNLLNARRSRPWCAARNRRATRRRSQRRGARAR